MRSLVVKYGGAAMEDPQLCFAVAKEMSNLANKSTKLVVVHGGGKEISSQLQRLNIETKFINGQRYTDEETLVVSEMLLSGTINKRIVSLLQQNGSLAVGISGRDARMAKMSRMPDTGFVGKIESLDSRLIQTLLAENFIPVISPISEEESGQPLNVNADDMARAVGESLKTDALIYLSDVDGLQIGGQLVRRINSSEVRELLKHPEVKGGMIPKLSGALSAVENGVKKVIFLNGTKPELLRQLVSNELTLATEICI